VGTISAILLDRDGTLIREREYLADPAGVEPLPGAVAGLRRFREWGCPVLVLTNQSGVARGFFTAREVDAIHGRLDELLAAEGVGVDGYFVCPHGPDDGCRCRKPLPGLVEQAAARFGFDPRLAVVIGDKPSDLELGRGVAARSILVRTGYGRASEPRAASLADAVVDDLAAAAEWLARQETRDDHA
jgi:D-glycero-D-manno-heptose 1,7-bisphosphate phosphatase